MQRERPYTVPTTDFTFLLACQLPFENEPVLYLEKEPKNKQIEGLWPRHIS